MSSSAITIFLVFTVVISGNSAVFRFFGYDNGNDYYCSNDLKCNYVNGKPEDNVHVMCGDRGEFSPICNRAEYLPIDKIHQDLILQLYNKLRSSHALGKNRPESFLNDQKGIFNYEVAGMATLVWDDELEMMALRNAAQCHQPGPLKNTCQRTKHFMYTGQTSSFTCQPSRTPSQIIQQSIIAWYDEHQHLTDLKPINAYKKSLDNTKQWSNFTQIVQDTAIAVGCSVVKTHNHDEKDKTCHMVSCVYSFGNVIGTPVYKTGAVGSKCPEPGKMHPEYPGLCSAAQDFSKSSISTVDSHGLKIKEFIYAKAEIVPPVQRWIKDGKKGPVWKPNNKIELFDVNKDLEIRLYTREHPTKKHVLTASTIAKTPFNTNRPTRIFSHGFRGIEETFDLYREAFLKLGDYNFIAVDWVRGANTINYFSAKNLVSPIADKLAELIDALVKKGLKLQDVTMVGHSLGSHIVGVAAKRLKTPGRIARIIGLDPASILFDLKTVDNRISIASAEYVEIIHTDTYKFGFSSPLGHADYYPNGGSAQPGCPKPGLYDLSWNSLMNSVKCSHVRSHDLFLESLTTYFEAIRCSSYDEIKTGTCTFNNVTSIMGGDDISLKKKPHGIFYLETKSSSPFNIENFKEFKKIQFK